MANFRIYNETLNPELWDANQHLDPTVRMTLLRLAYDFYEKTKFPASIIDVYLMGSISNYNWTADSDVDVHVIIDYSKLQMHPETAAKAVKTAGAQWNLEHDITVKGFKVEMNLQNFSEQKPYVTGIYSLVKDQWIRRPFKMPVQIDRNVLRFQYDAMKKYVQNALNSGDREQMKSAKKYLDAYRQYGLDTYGELSYENIIFKILRARGIVKKLKDSITSVYDKQMTVKESENAGHKHFTLSPPDKNNVVGINFDGKRFAQAYIVPPSWGKYGGKWVFNKGGMAIDMKHSGFEKGYDKPEDILPDLEKWYSKRTSVSEVGERDIKQTLPGIDPSRFDRDYWDKMNKETGHFMLQRLTMDELKALREKEVRAVAYCQGHESPAHEAFHRKMYFRYDNELKRRLAQINAPITEARIKWKKEAEDESFYTSVDGEYSLIPIYIGRQRVQKWKIKNNKTGKEDYAMTLKDARDKADRMRDPNFVPATKSYVAKGTPEQIQRQMQDNYDYFIKNNQRDNAEVVRKNAEAVGIKLNVKPLTESPLMTKQGATALSGDKPLKDQNVEEVSGNIVVIRQGKGGGVIAEGFTLVYFMDSDESAKAMAEGELPYLMVPRGTFMGGGSPITDVWKRKFQKPGTEHILGIIEGHSDEQTIFIDMISVRPGWKRNHIAKLMMDRLKKTFPKAKLTTSVQTDAGQKLFKSYGGEQQKPTMEGYGSGIPEKDRLKIKNTDGSVRRWQIRSKDAPKTPKMTDKIVKAIPESDFEEGQTGDCLTCDLQT